MDTLIMCFKLCLSFEYLVTYVFLLCLALQLTVVLPFVWSLVCSTKIFTCSKYVPFHRLRILFCTFNHPVTATTNGYWISLFRLFNHPLTAPANCYWSLQLNGMIKVKHVVTSAFGLVTISQLATCVSISWIFNHPMCTYIWLFEFRTQPRHCHYAVMSILYIRVPYWLIH